MPPISLLSDFGSRDSYVAEMKAVLLRIAGESHALIDISHEVPAFDIRRAAFMLADSCEAFPAESIHLAVVDPGVGSSRKRLLLRFETAAKLPQWFVGPDNGICSFLLGGSWQAWEIGAIPADYRFGESSTFDGRDYFAPCAGMIARGAAADSFCTPLSEVVRLPAPHRISNADSIEGELVYFDHYGNAATSIRRGDTAALIESSERLLEVLVSSVDPFAVRLCTHFAELRQGEIAALWNSHGRLELVAREHSARQLRSLELGDRVVLRSRAIPETQASAQPE